jgi:hypothetical protein
LRLNPGQTSGALRPRAPEQNPHAVSEAASHGSPRLAAPGAGLIASGVNSGEGAAGAVQAGRGVARQVESCRTTQTMRTKIDGQAAAVARCGKNISGDTLNRRLDLSMCPFARSRLPFRTSEAMLALPKTSTMSTCRNPFESIRWRTISIGDAGAKSEARQKEHDRPLAQAVFRIVYRTPRARVPLLPPRLFLVLMSAATSEPTGTAPFEAKNRINPLCWVISQLPLCYP